jgi:hypothetical protein
VKVNKVLRDLSVQIDSNIQNIGVFHIDICLVDKRPSVNGQIVSNVLTTNIPIRMGRVLPWNAQKGPAVLLRSNYAQKEVGARIILRHKRNLGIEEELGRIELELQDEQLNTAVKNQAHTKHFGNVKFSFEVTDSTQSERMQTE